MFFSSLRSRDPSIKNLWLFLKIPSDYYWLNRRNHNYQGGARGKERLNFTIDGSSFICIFMVKRFAWLICLFNGKSTFMGYLMLKFFQAAVISILLYGCTTWILTKRLEKKLAGNYSRMLQAILNKSWWQHPTKHQLYGHLPPIMKTIQVRRTRHAAHCWRSRDELISDVLLWTPTYGRAKAGWPARTYIQQLCEDTGCSLEDLPEAMNDREKWRERVRDISACGTTWWWMLKSSL